MERVGSVRFAGEREAAGCRGLGKPGRGVPEKPTSASCWCVSRGQELQDALCLLLPNQE